jgi:hypothetical protein
MGFFISVCFPFLLRLEESKFSTEAKVEVACFRNVERVFFSGVFLLREFIEREPM